jgi:hypothetical protein
VWAKIKLLCIGFAFGIVLSGIIALWISSSAGSKLIADLNAAKWSLESASRTNANITAGLQDVSIKLKDANRIIIDQQSILNRQQSIIDGQKSIIEQIKLSIDGTGNDIGRKIQAIADGFRQLYNLYH